MPKEYEELMSREDHLEEIASKNKNIQERINVIDAKIKANNEFLEEKIKHLKKRLIKLLTKKTTYIMHVLIITKIFYQSLVWVILMIS